MPESSTKHPQSLSNTKENTAQVELVLTIARRLHRSVKTGSIARAMPILRRLDSAQCLPHMTLKDLFANKAELKRKHFIRLLAKEAGYDSWEAYKAYLTANPDTENPHALETIDDVSTLNHWFSNTEEASAYAEQHGGKVASFGEQAVVYYHAQKGGL